MKETNYIDGDGSMTEEKITSMKNELGNDKIIVITMFMTGDNLREVSYIANKDMNVDYHTMAFKNVLKLIEDDKTTGDRLS